MVFWEIKKIFIDVFLVEKIYSGIHFQFLSLQSKTNVLSVGNKNCKRQHASYKLEMDQNSEPRDKSTANQISMRVTEGTCDLRKHMKTHSGEKTNKCNQCDYASSQAGHLRTHLKTHSGEKPNKCNQCNFAPSQAGHLRAHLKTHSLLKWNSMGIFLFIHFLSKVTICCQKLTNVAICCQLLLSTGIISYWLLSVKS